MKIVIDGNDGTGKSTIVAAMAKSGFVVSDRGVPTRMTDDESVQPNDDEFYIILDAPVDICQQRLRMAGRSIEERYHNLTDLRHYRERFLLVAEKLGDRCLVIDASQGFNSVICEIMNRLPSEAWQR